VREYNVRFFALKDKTTVEAAKACPAQFTAMQWLTLRSNDLLRH